MRGFTLLLVAVVSLGAGYALRAWQDAGSPADTNARTFQAPGPPVSPRPATDAASTPREAPPEFGALLEPATPFDTLYLAFQLAAAADVPTLKRYITEALKIEDPLFQYNVSEIFLERLSALDRDAALAYVESLSSSRTRQYLMASVLGTWARVDKEAAQAYLASITDPVLKQATAHYLGGTLELDDPNTNPTPARPRVEALLAEGPSRANTEALTVAMLSLSQQDPMLALDYLQRFPDRLSRAELGVLSALARADREFALPLVEDYINRTDDISPMSEILRAWVEEDTAGALDYYNGLPNHYRSQASVDIGLAYVEKDPRAGLNWIMDGGHGVSSMLDIAIRTSSPAVAEEAESMLNELPEGGRRSRLLVAVARERSSQYPAETVAWLERYRADAGFEEAYGRVMVQWAFRDPEAAATQLENQPPAEEYEYVYGTVAESMAERDLDAAIAWADGLPSRAQAAAKQDIIGSLATSDFDRARVVYASLPEGPDKDRAGAELAMAREGRNRSRMVALMRELGVSEEYISSFTTVVLQ